MSDGRWIEAEDLQIGERQAVQVLTLEQARDRAEADAVTVALRESDGNMSRAADRLGVSRMTLYRLVQRLNLDHGQVQEARAAARLAVSGVA
jgi:DNA-binding NtrC family response regulator